jgi:hypothetical protein
MLERREDEQAQLARLKEALTQQGMFKDRQMKLLATRGLGGIFSVAYGLAAPAIISSLARD